LLMVMLDVCLLIASIDMNSREHESKLESERNNREEDTWLRQAVM
jgi:hypothetical protein